MSTKRCYYETLEVERTVDDGTLKTAFRKLAMKWHPDKNQGDPQSEVRFKEIAEAYEVLKDGDKPGDIPVAVPYKEGGLEIKVNLATAKKLGITLPADFLKKAQTIGP